MLKMKQKRWIIFVLLLNGCQSNENNTESLKITTDTTFSEEINENKSLDGYWILTDYFDSIFKDKAIAKHRLYKIAWSAMSFKIKEDSMFSTGLLYLDNHIKLDSESDTLCDFENFGEFIFYYNKELDRIEATDILLENNKFKDKKYTYRRVEEEYLQSMLMKANPFEVRKDFYQLYIDSLIAGEYHSTADQGILTLSRNGISSGFKNYNKYAVHDYFGTYHPFQNYDVICFEDTTIAWEINSPPTEKQIAYYNWTFAGDTLTLTKMLTENFEEYFLGKQQYKYIKWNN